MIRIRSRGNFTRTNRFLRFLHNREHLRVLEKYGERGVRALSASTPIESGKTASSWSYEIHYGIGSASIVWTNSNINDGVNIAVILQYGHGTGTGGYVVGRDYINPALRPVFDTIAENVWAEVVNA